MNVRLSIAMRPWYTVHACTHNKIVFLCVMYLNLVSTDPITEVELSVSTVITGMERQLSNQLLARNSYDLCL